jgi:hypothetical protein
MYKSELKTAGRPKGRFPRAHLEPASVVGTGSNVLPASWVLLEIINPAETGRLAGKSF